jgi:hypothetical protein
MVELALRFMKFNIGDLYFSCSLFFFFIKAGEGFEIIKLSSVFNTFYTKIFSLISRISLYSIINFSTSNNFNLLRAFSLLELWMNLKFKFWGRKNKP